MDSLAPDLSALFAQLGEADDEASINRFIEKNGHLCGHTPLHEAVFWSPAQATFLRDALLQDANWAPVVDTLNVRLHEVGQSAACALERHIEIASEATSKTASQSSPRHVPGKEPP